jgi:hypothetical protein
MTKSKPRATPKGKPSSSKATGRPSSFTQKAADQICERLGIGESLRSICRDNAMPSISTVCKWLRDFPEFSQQYARAREVQADTLVDEILDIADDGSNDWMERREGENTGWKENGEALRRSQLRIDARRRLAGKMRPKKHGDKVIQEHSGPDGGPIKTEDLADMDRARAVAATFARVRATSGAGA